MDTLSKSVRELEQYLGMDDAEDQPTPRKAAGGKTPQPGQKAAPAKKQKKAMPQTAKKSPADLPTQTLMEQRPDREPAGNPHQGGSVGKTAEKCF